MKKFIGWILVILGVALLVGAIISSPMTLGWGIFGPIPHFIGAGLVYWGQGLIRGDREKSEASRKAKIAVGCIGIFAGATLTFICAGTLMVSGNSLVSEVLWAVKQEP